MILIEICCSISGRYNDSFKQNQSKNKNNKTKNAKGKQETKHMHKNIRDLRDLIHMLCIYSTGGRDESIHYNQ